MNLLWACPALDFSKTLSPGLRVGWVLAPHTVRDKLVLAAESAVLSQSNFSQLAVGQYPNTQPRSSSSMRRSEQRTHATTATSTHRGPTPHDLSGCGTRHGDAEKLGLPGYVGRKVAMSDLNRVLVLAGGSSHEREVSLRSGRRVTEALRATGVEVETRDAGAELLPTVVSDPPDAAFVTLHGAAGEDGAIRDVLELLELPYVGAAGCLPCRLRQTDCQGCGPRGGPLDTGVGGVPRGGLSQSWWLHATRTDHQPARPTVVRETCARRIVAGGQWRVPR